MKNMLILLGAAALLAGVAVPVSAERALVINPAEGCTIADGNALDDFASGGIGAINWVSSDDARIVATRSNKGNAKYVCKISDVPNDTGSTVHFNSEIAFELLGAPFPCAFVDGVGGVYVTMDWRQIVTPAGEAKLICKFKE